MIASEIAEIMFHLHPCATRIINGGTFTLDLHLANGYTLIDLQDGKYIQF